MCGIGGLDTGAVGARADDAADCGTSKPAAPAALGAVGLVEVLVAPQKPHLRQAQFVQCERLCAGLHHDSHASCFRSLVLVDVQATVPAHPAHAAHSGCEQWLSANPSRVHQVAQVESVAVALASAALAAPLAN